MLDALAALTGVVLLFAVPVWVAVGMPVSRRSKVVIAVGGIAGTAAWVWLLFWLATR